ncbi:hypothetical protein HMPREF0281_01062 [Corynebacterium ammoniagenes DSM 20306]|uniref:Uncharacterized protein n=1 Tax=Corynebacterium ammoniagenes DSM 20306 TaxID=649754 RepID=A0ABN0AFR2_CORAM|nr:hypothetical protein HMPREF0281_01062 [Corynebacterium ammoniagenes DSM 20306]
MGGGLLLLLKQHREETRSVLVMCHLVGVFEEYFHVIGGCQG